MEPREFIALQLFIEFGSHQIKSGDMLAFGNDADLDPVHSAEEAWNLLDDAEKNRFRAHAQGIVEALGQTSWFHQGLNS
jgi:hypothetical protein